MKILRGFFYFYVDYLLEHIYIKNVSIQIINSFKILINALTTAIIIKLVISHMMLRHKIIIQIRYDWLLLQYEFLLPADNFNIFFREIYKNMQEHIRLKLRFLISRVIMITIIKYNKKFLYFLSDMIHPFIYGVLHIHKASKIPFKPL